MFSTLKNNVYFERVKTVLPYQAMAGLLLVLVAGFFFMDTAAHRLIMYFSFPLILFAIFQKHAIDLYACKNDWLCRLALAYLCVTVLSLLWSSGMDVERIWQKIKPTPFLMIFGAGVFIVLQTYKTAWNAMVGAYILAALVSGAALLWVHHEGFLNYYVYGTHDQVGAWRMPGFGRAENKNMAGLFYGLASVLILFKKDWGGFSLKYTWQEILLRAGGALFLFGILFLTLSRGALLSFCVVMAVAVSVYMFTSEGGRKMKALLLGGYAIVFSSILALLFSKPETATYIIERGTSGRLKIWETALGYIWEKPLFGHGVGTKFIYDVKEGYLTISAGHAHNLYLSVLLQVGCVGFLIFMALCAVAWLSALKCAVRLKDFAPLIMLTYGFSMGFVDFGGYYDSLAPSWIVFWLPLAYLIYSRSNKED